MDGETWGVWCTVSGGVTGRRESWLKDGDFIFRGTEDQARAKATEYSREMRVYSCASFNYTARRISA